MGKFRSGEEQPFKETMASLSKEKWKISMKTIINRIFDFMNGQSKLIGYHPPKERMTAAFFMSAFWVGGVLNFMLLFIHEGDMMCIVLGFFTALLIKRRYFRGKTQGTILDIALSEFYTTF